MQQNEELQNSSVSNILEPDLSSASQAFGEFNKENYESCINLLSKLSSKGQDKKVLINQAVAEYYKSGFSKTTEFQSSLTEISKKLQTESLNNLAEFTEYCSLYYNTAVVSYNLKQYTQAVQCFKRLESFGENIDEALLYKIIYLLIDANLSSYKPFKALDMIEYLERLQGESRTNNDDCEKSDKENIKDEKQMHILKQYRLKCYLMMRSMNNLFKEVKLSTDNSKESLFLKAQYELLMRKYSQSIKTLSFHQGNDIKNKYSTMCCANNIAVNYFEMKKFNLAHRYLLKAIEHKNVLMEIYKKNGSSLESLTNNKHYELLYNMGVTLLHCNKPLLAFDCLLGVVQVYQFNPRLWLRLAECSVMVHKQSNQDDCSYEKKMSVIHDYVGSSVHRKVVLGLGANNKNINNSKDSSAMPMPTMGFASLCLENALLCINNMKNNTDKQKVKKKKNNKNDEDKDGKDDEDDENSDDDKSVDEATSNDDEHIPNELFIAVAPSNPVKQNEVNNLRCSILALKTYIALQHKNYLIALHDSDTLLQQPSLSGMHRYLGLMYKAEALVGLDRLPESIDLLITDVNDINVFSDDNINYIQRKDDEDVNKCEPNTEKLQNNFWFPHSIDGARCLMSYNMAVVCVINGDFVKARTFLGKSLEHLKQPYPFQAYYLMIYLEIAEGKIRSKNPFNIASVIS